jgi:hypothetical protein
MDWTLDNVVREGNWEGGDVRDSHPSRITLPKAYLTKIIVDLDLSIQAL